MKTFTRSAWVILTAALVSALGVADELPVVDESIRIMSWNISDDAFVTEQRAFQSVLLWANPDIVLLDEVAPGANPETLKESLENIRPGTDGTWNLDLGISGGRQRGLIASRMPLERLPEFSSVVPYPETEKHLILNAMSAKERARPDWSMEGGIPVNGALIQAGSRQLFVVVADLQCCGDGPTSWQEFRRRIEAREIRQLIHQVVEKNSVDGIVFAGDFNLVNSTFPMSILTGPYPLPQSGLIPAELYHPDGKTTWTWDGRRTPFPSNTLDYQLYGPHGLEMGSGLILDTEGASRETRKKFGLEASTLKRTGRHRPLVVEYNWN